MTKIGFTQLMIKTNSELKVALAMLAIVLAVQTSAAQSPQAGLRGEPEAIAKARSLVQAMGGQTLWAEMKTLHLRHQLLFVGASDKRIEGEYYDLVGPRKYTEVRSEVLFQIRVTGPGIGWSTRNGEVSHQSPAEVERSVKGAPGSMWRIIRRIAVNDPTLEIKSKKDNPHRLEFFDSSGLLCWIDVDTVGEPVIWGRPEVEWVWGPLKSFGSMRIPAWGAYTNGRFRLEMLEAKGSREPFSRPLDAPSKNQTAN